MPRHFLQLSLMPEFISGQLLQVINSSPIRFAIVASDLLGQSQPIFLVLGCVIVDTPDRKRVPQIWIQSTFLNNLSEGQVSTIISFEELRRRNNLPSCSLFPREHQQRLLRKHGIADVLLQEANNIKRITIASERSFLHAVHEGRRKICQRHSKILKISI